LSNIDRFANEVHRSPELQNRLAYARAWYAHRDEDGRWLFGPSKFVGYKGLDAALYIDNTKDNDGRRTEAQLEQWFTVVDPSSPLHEELNAALFAFLAKYGKAPSTKARINILKEVFEASVTSDKNDPNEALVELLATVAKSLPPIYAARLRAKLA
jgi:hypothetical protein